MGFTGDTKTTTWRVGSSALLLIWVSFAGAALAAPDASTKAGPIIPLPPDVAKDLEVFGEGVVGKAVPAPPLEDLEHYLNIGPGQWKYKIVSGKDGKNVRVESYTAIPDSTGDKAWKRAIGDEYNEYVRMHPDGSFVKYAEDDIDVGYGADIVPGVLVPVGMKPGETKTIESQIRAFKMKDPDKIEYTGKITTRLTYVGAYQVTTPAGTWPASLIRNDFEVHIGPANVKDTIYAFYAGGVGKVAEIEAMNISALFVYHSNEKTVKVLSELPVRTK